MGMWNVIISDNLGIYFRTKNFTHIHTHTHTYMHTHIHLHTYIHT